MQLKLHSKAAERINELAQEGRVGVKSGTMKIRRQESSWKPDRPTRIIDEKSIVGPIRMRSAGSEPFFYMHGQQGGRVLRDEPAHSLRSAIELLVKGINSKGAVSYEAVRNVAEEWVFDESIKSPFSDYAIAKLGKQIRTFTVWIPISNLAVQSARTVGRVEFRPVTSECMDRWYKSGAYATLTAEAKEQIDKDLAKTEKVLRGNAAGVVEVTAEPIAARSLALDLARTSLNLLIFFSPELIRPTVHNHCALHGQENIERYWVFLEADGQFVRTQRGLVHDVRSLILNDERFEDMRKAGLERISSVLLSKKQSEFQSRLLASITLYAEASRERRFTNRLVLMLAALEGTFLKNASEPIQQNLGERIAVLLETNAEKRIEIIKLIRRVYSRRSRFVHHSEHIELDDDIEKFVEIGWYALCAAIDYVDKFDTPNQFVDGIDYLKMGGNSL